MFFKNILEMKVKKNFINLFRKVFHSLASKLEYQQFIQTMLCLYSLNLLIFQMKILFNMI